MYTPQLIHADNNTIHPSTTTLLPLLTTQETEKKAGGRGKDKEKGSGESLARDKRDKGQEGGLSEEKLQAQRAKQAKAKAAARVKLNQVLIFEVHHC